MKQNKLKLSLNMIVILLLVGAIALGRNYIVNNKQAVTHSSASEVQQHLDAVEVLESQNLNVDPPQYQLHLQHVQMYGMPHEAFTARPERLLLVDKTTGTTRLDLPLAPSQYSNECALMMQDLDTFTKWNTDWFSIPELPASDASYDSDLVGNYDVQVVYADDTEQVYYSINPIDRVCYQISQSISVPPITDEEDGLPIEP